MKRISLLLILSFSAALAHAGELAIRLPEHCGNLRIDVKNQPLSQVLQRLAEKLHFDLYFAASMDRPVTVSLNEPPLALLKQMLARDGFMLVERHDAVCNRSVPDALWVLAEGDYNADQAVRYTAPVTAAPEPQPTAEDIKESKRGGHRKYMTPEERYNERVRRRLEKQGAVMVSGTKQSKEEQ